MAHFFALRDGYNAQQQNPGVSVPYVPTMAEVLHNGTGAFLSSPQEIEEIFRGITLAVYDAILALYLSPVGRSHVIIHEILSRMAAVAQAQQPTAEAVWAICQNSSAKCRRKFRPTRLVRDIVWELAAVPVTITADYQTGATVQNIDAIIAWNGHTIIAASLARRENVAAEAGLALFDAVVSQRTHDLYSQSGILWNLPYLIRGPNRLLPVVTPVCQHLGLQVSPTPNASPDFERHLARIYADWNHHMPAETKKIQQWQLIFDTYLKHTIGVGPDRQADHQRELDRHHPKLGLDPGTLFPELRLLLPGYPVTVRENGVIYHQRMRYTDPLLALWVGETVLLRPSPYTFQRGWVYTEDEIICELKPIYETI